MIRPAAIVTYERLYWAAFAIGIAGTATGWTAARAALMANPLTATMTWLLPVALVGRIALAALLWYFTARVPSLVAKWVVVVFAALGGAWILVGAFALVSGSGAMATGTLLGMLSNAVSIVAAAMLFLPDAKAWFGESLDEEDRPA